MDSTPTAASTPSAAATQTEFKTVVAQANAGDKAALASLRQKLDDHPNIWADIGRIALESERTLIERVAGGDRLVEEAVRRTLGQMRTDLTSGSSPAEKMAVDRVVVAWLFLQLADKALAADGGAALQAASWSPLIATSKPIPTICSISRNGSRYFKSVRLWSVSNSCPMLIGCC